MHEKIVCLSIVLFISATPLANAEEATMTALLKTFRQEFVAIKPGQFQMGSQQGLEDERPVHQVKIKTGFMMAKYEVPQNLYSAVMGQEPSRWKGPRNSVEMITQVEAVKFCEKATILLRKEKLITAKQRVRLPSEAEWEYCARAGTTTTYSFGDDAKLLGDYAWYTGNAAGNDPPVGVKKPNAWGLYDMHGYLWEWCQDNWTDTYEEASGNQTPVIKNGETLNVIRGGSWKDPAHKCTSSYRIGIPHDAKDSALGFRCVLE